MGMSSVWSTLIGAGGMMAKKSLTAFNFLETFEGDMLIAKDGSLATVIRIDGMRKMIGQDELNGLVKKANTKLSPYFSKSGHALQVYFCRDPDLSAQLLKNMMVMPRTVARAVKIDLDDVFEERERHLQKFMVHEAFYMVVWTRLSVLSKQEMERASVSRKPPPMFPRAFDSQGMFLAARQLVVRHKAFATSFLADLSQFGIRAEAIDGHDAIRALKSSVYPDLTAHNWKPYAPGDTGVGAQGEARVPWPKVPEMPSGDMSHLLWPRLDDQIFDRGAEVVNQQIVKIGRYYFAGVDMTMGPQDILPFSQLISRMRDLDEFPWRVSFLVEGNGLRFGARAFLASVCGFTNSENKLLVDAIKALTAHQQSGKVVTRLRISFATWAPGDNLALIEDRANRLQRAVESWGYCEVSPSAGDPLAGVFSSALALDCASTAPAGGAPLEDVIYMLPWDRDASPFTTGSVLFRTEDKRPWPWQPGSSQQDTFIDIVYSPPGGGKSVWLNTTSLAFCLSPVATSGAGGAKLPRVAILDIGPSSEGLISLLKEALPPHRRHEADYRRLRMIKEHAINPFDTQLGARKPVPLERSFLVNFITLLGTEVGLTAPPAGLSGLAGVAVDTLYEKFSDKSRAGQPRLYTSEEDEEVDLAIGRFMVELDEHATWWEVVDKLFAAGAHREAALAQRHAVPRVEDLSAIVNNRQIGDIYGSAITDDEQLLKVFQRVISTSLREYPILTQPTRFDLGDARVVALDIDEAAPKGGKAADKQTALVYMLGRFAIARDFYLNEKDVAYFPDEYVAYQDARIRRIRETPKRLILDEYSRTKAAPVVRDQVKVDCREGRKWGVQVALASQLLDDFDKDIIDLATGFWIMRCSESEITTAAEKFGLSKAAVAALETKLNGPGPDGAPFLAVLTMKDGRHEHLLYNTLGPMEIWAFSTTMEDVAIRKRLYARLGPQEARRRLARRFPNGSAKKEVDRRQMELAERGSTSREAAQGVIEQIALEIIGTG